MLHNCYRAPETAFHRNQILCCNAIFDPRKETYPGQGSVRMPFQWVERRGSGDPILLPGFALGDAGIVRPLP